VPDRLILSNAVWERMAPHTIGDERTRGSSGRDNVPFVEALLWIIRTCAPWPDPPEVFGHWNRSFRRFSRWSAKGVWHRTFAAMAADPGFEYLIVDSTIVKERHRTECCSAKRRPFRRVAIRCEKNRLQLPRRRRPGRHHPMAQATVHTTWPDAKMRIDEDALFRSGRAETLMEEAGLTTPLKRSLVSSESGRGER
jgi:putative transposase